jgi:hypothetical protein
MYEAKVPTSSELPADRRTAKRHMAVLLLVKLAVDGREALARITNLSRTGARIETSLPLQQGLLVGIELRSDAAADAIVRWVDGQSAGVEFTAPIDVDRFLSRKVSTLSRQKPRSPRYVCDAPARITTEEGSFTADLMDLSLSGARISADTEWKTDDTVVVAIEGLKPRRARIAWTRKEMAGIEFMLPLNYREFDVWLANGGGRPQKD